MTRISKLLGVAAAALMMVALQAAPASAQFAGGGGEDMMTQMAPMLNMMKAKMGKKRFGMLMQTMGPMMSNMMDGSGGFGGMNFGGFGGGNFGGYGGGYSAPYAGTPYIGGDYGTATSSYVGGGLPFIGGAGGFNARDMMGKIPQLMSIAGTGNQQRRHVRHKG